MNIDKILEEINKKLKELGFEETQESPKSKKTTKDQTKEAIETIRTCTKEVLEIEDLKSEYEKDPKTFSNRILTITSWFNYLKRNKKNTKEFEEAKKLIQNIKEKHNKLNSWCEYLLENK